MVSTHCWTTLHDGASVHSSATGEKINVTNGPQEGEGSSVWNRLRRRKVVQWGLAYTAGAWGFQQAVAYVSTLLDWPLQVQRLTGLVLLLGLPVAVTLAWYHGDKGQQRITRI